MPVHAQLVWRPVLNLTRNSGSLLVMLIVHIAFSSFLPTQAFDQNLNVLCPLTRGGTCCKNAGCVICIYRLLSIFCLTCIFCIFRLSSFRQESGNLQMDSPTIRSFVVFFVLILHLSSCIMKFMKAHVTG